MAACVDGHEVILCEAILAEVRRHLAGKFKMPARQADEIVAFLREHAQLVEPAEVARDACRDPNDRMVLGAAVAGGADCVVTGDADLLVLKSFEGIPILTPRGFYDLVRGE